MDIYIPANILMPAIYGYTKALLLCFFLTACISSEDCNKSDNPIAFWDFSKYGGGTIKSECGKYSLEAVGDITTSQEGPVSGKSVVLDGKSYLKIPYEKTGRLNVKTNAVTVAAWVKWSGKGIGFVGGMWNETQDGGLRQYGLFVSLPHYNGANQVCGHISKTGKATPPFPYSIDYSASPQEVPPNKWTFVAFTYDGSYIRSYLNGKFISRPVELIDHTKGFPGFPEGLRQSKNPYFFPFGIGDNGSDFTVGAVMLKNGMGNFFTGKIGSLSVYDRALDAEEIASLFSNKYSEANVQ